MSPPRQLTALVTNDDGVDAPGLMVLASAALDAGMRVVVAAPTWDSSGASASFTAVERDGKVLASTRVVSALDDSTVAAVEAAPAFIVRAGVAGAFGPRPDLVLSGANEGANTGRAVLHSGTVGAALTASTLGVPALAVSVAGSPVSPQGWETCRLVLADVLPRFAELDLDVVNLNVPDVAYREMQGVRVAALSPSGAVQVANTELNGNRLEVTYHPVEADEDDGTDAQLLRAGWSTLTTLQAPCEDPSTREELGKLLRA